MSHWTWPKAIFLIITVGPIGFGAIHWGVSQTFDNLKIDVICGQVRSIFYMGRTFESGYVDIMIGFENSGMPMELDWTLTAQTNVTGGAIPAFFQATIPIGKSLLNMTSYVSSWVGNGTVQQLFSFTKYSALWNLFSDPRIFSQEIPVNNPIHDYRKVNDTANYLPIAVGYLFYSQTGSYPRAILSSGSYSPSCRKSLAVYGF